MKLVMLAGSTCHGAACEGIDRAQHNIDDAPARARRTLQPARHTTTQEYGLHASGYPALQAYRRLHPVAGYNCLTSNKHVPT